LLFKLNQTGFSVLKQKLRLICIDETSAENDW
jgi:hypothetical protein